MKNTGNLFSLLAICIIFQSLMQRPYIKKYTPEKLGEKLFFDTILSSDKSISCASCHKPAFAFADTIAFSKGVHGKIALRNTPSVMNVASRESLFWDGRANTLEEQALGPIQNPNEMNLPIDSAIARLNKNKFYVNYFKQTFNSKPTEQTLQKALASFEKTLETTSTANDRWINEEPNGLNEMQQKGRTIFFTKGKCIECHYTPDFTGDEFKNIGIFNGKNWNDSGRYLITKNVADIGKFKVPGLRNVAVTAPYMHNGSFKTLMQVIQFYNKPAASIAYFKNIDTLLQKPLNLSQNEMEELETFLQSLTDKQFEKNN